MNKEFIIWYFEQQKTYISLETIKETFKEQAETILADIAPFFDVHKKYGVTLNPRFALGILEIKRTVAFLVQKDTNDLVVELEHLENALDQDLVIVEKTRRFNKVKAVIKSHLTQIIANVHKTIQGIRFDSLQTEGRSIKVYNIPDYLVDGHVVLLKIREISLREITTDFGEVIGHKNDPDMDIVRIIYEYQWPLKFPHEVIKQVHETKYDLTYEKSTRVDLTNQLIVTIDGADAKDLDDAISLTKNTDGTFELGVHIADVSYFVPENSPLDQEAFNRATSVYLADRVIPMIPHGLSNDLCSLNPHESKFTLTCQMTLSEQMEVIDYKIFPSIIESKYRLTYQAVNELLKNNQSLGNQTLDDMLFKMNEMAQKLKVIRRKRGAIEFESSELKFELDLEGHVLKIEERKTDDAEMLIESFMILANETVAKHFHENHLPGIYRVHEKPDVDKLDTALLTVEKLGFKHDKSSKTTAKILQKLTQQSLATPYQYIIHMILLRSMQKAKYSPSPIGHFGLASDYYSHFTSPIRRYPDLLLHRMIRNLVFETNKKEFVKKKSHFEMIMYHYCEQSSEQERKAINMERDVVKLKSCDYMQNHIGEVYQGLIIQIMPSGFFVKIENGVEGFVALRNVPCYLIYDEENLLFFTNNGKKYRLGDQVEVKLIKVDMVEKQIDFTVTSELKIRGNNFSSRGKKKNIQTIISRNKKNQKHKAQKRKYS